MIETMPMSLGRELPEFHLRQEDLPDLLTWKVGGQYYIVMKVEMVGVEKMNNLPESSDHPKMEGRFIVHSMRALDDKPIDTKTLEKQEWDKMVAKVKSGEI